MDNKVRSYIEYWTKWQKRGNREFRCGEEKKKSDKRKLSLYSFKLNRKFNITIEVQAILENLVKGERAFLIFKDKKMIFFLLKKIISCVILFHGILKE